MTVDWGDGTIETVPAGQLPLQHTYISASTYTVQTAYTVYAADGTICWQRNDDDTIISSSREENAGAVTLLAYPNPTDGIIHFRFGEELGSPSVTVFSMNGRAVRSASNLRNRELSLAGLSAGVYVVTLRFPGGEIARQRVILR